MSAISSVHPLLPPVRQLFHEIILQVLVGRHIQFSAHMSAHHSNILLRLVKQLADFAQFLTLQDEATHVHLRFREGWEEVRKVTVIHQMTPQMHAHSIDDIALRLRGEHCKQAVHIVS